MAIIKVCIFQNKNTKKYKWLSLESPEGQSERYLYESAIDAEVMPSQRPSVEGEPGTLVDYENDKERILTDGYDIVTQQ
jgi:hypothetical protein